MTQNPQIEVLHSEAFISYLKNVGSGAKQALSPIAF